MTIRIKKTGYTIEVDSELELRLALKVLNEPDPQLPLMPSTTADVAESPRRLAGKTIQSNDPYGDLLKALHVPKQRSVLAVLAQNAGDMTDSQLRTALNLPTNMALAGIWTAILRNASHFGLKLEQIIEKSKSGPPKNRVYTYRLTDSMRNAVLKEGTPNHSIKNNGTLH